MAKIKKGDKVLVITGKDKNKTGIIDKVFYKTNRVVVTGLNIVKKHLKKSKKHPQGGIIDKSMPIHISNVMLLDPTTNKPTRVTYKISSDKKYRFALVSGQRIEELEKNVN